MSEQIKKELQEITEKLKKMDARGLSIMNRDASTILLCQEMMMGENVEREAGQGERKGCLIGPDQGQIGQPTIDEENEIVNDI